MHFRPLYVILDQLFFHLRGGGQAVGQHQHLGNKLYFFGGSISFYLLSSFQRLYLVFGFLDWAYLTRAQITFLLDHSPTKCEVKIITPRASLG